MQQYYFTVWYYLEAWKCLVIMATFFKVIIQKIYQKVLRFRVKLHCIGTTGGFETGNTWIHMLIRPPTSLWYVIFFRLVKAHTKMLISWSNQYKVFAYHSLLTLPRSCLKCFFSLLFMVIIFIYFFSVRYGSPLLMQDGLRILKWPLWCELDP